MELKTRQASALDAIYSMPGKKSDADVRLIPAIYATEEEAVIFHKEATDALNELVRIIARADCQRRYRELMETGRCRWMSLYPNVDWEKHDAEWVAWDEEQKKTQREATRPDRKT